MDDNNYLILNALKDANKLGAKGIEVIGYLMPESVISDYRINLITRIPYPQSALDKPWYDE